LFGRLKREVVDWELAKDNVENEDDEMDQVP